MHEAVGHVWLHLIHPCYHPAASVQPCSVFYTYILDPTPLLHIGFGLAQTDGVDVRVLEWTHRHCWAVDSQGSGYGGEEWGKAGVIGLEQEGLNRRETAIVELRIRWFCAILNNGTFGCIGSLTAFCAC